jgi:hypothetical protein
MFEFSLTPHNNTNRNGKVRSRRTVAHLRKITGIAATLTKAGWPVWITMTGLAFSPPHAKERMDKEWVAFLLAELGIHEEFDPWTGRTVDEMPDGLATWMWSAR